MTFQSSKKDVSSPARPWGQQGCHPSPSHSMRPGGGWAVRATRLQIPEGLAHRRCFHGTSSRVTPHLSKEPNGQESAAAAFSFSPWSHEIREQESWFELICSLDRSARCAYLILALGGRALLNVSLFHTQPPSLPSL